MIFSLELIVSFTPPVASSFLFCPVAFMLIFLAASILISRSARKLKSPIVCTLNDSSAYMSILPSSDSSTHAVPVLFIMYTVFSESCNNTVLSEQIFHQLLHVYSQLQCSVVQIVLYDRLVQEC